MSLLTSRPGRLFLSKFQPVIIQKRNSVREEIHRYREPDKFKKHMLAATQPYFKRKYELPSELCKGNLPKEFEMEPLDKIYVEELINDFKQNDFVLFMQHNYTPFQSERVYKNKIIKSGCIFRSHKNSVYKEAFNKLEVDNLVQSLFVTRNSLAIGHLDRLTNCVTALRKMPQFILLAGCINREIYNYEQLVSISKQPNIDLCRASLSSILEMPSIELTHYLDFAARPHDE